MEQSQVLRRYSILLGTVLVNFMCQLSRFLVRCYSGGL
jgi:hypothetical protein